MNSDPVEKLASSEATNSTRRVISSGSAMRGIAKSLTAPDHNVPALGDEAARVAGTHSTGTTRDNHCPIIETFHHWFLS